MSRKRLKVSVVSKLRRNVLFLNSPSLQVDGDDDLDEELLAITGGQEKLHLLIDCRHLISRFELIKVIAVLLRPRNASRKQKSKKHR